jgi:Ala-tRNA(Pro) deacylase
MSRTTEYLERRGVEFETIAHASAFTTLDEAKALGVEADGVAKTLLLETVSGPALAVLCGDRRLDLQRVERLTGDKQARLAKESEIQADFGDFELGCLPPLPSLLGVPALVDREVMAHETIVFAAGTRTESVKAKTADLFREGQVTVDEIAAGPDER